MRLARSLCSQCQIENIVSKNEKHDFRHAKISFLRGAVFLEAQKEIDEKREGIERDKCQRYKIVVRIHKVDVYVHRKETVGRRVVQVISPRTAASC